MNNGSILKTLLSQRGMTIKDLAQKTGISIHTLYSITKRNSDNIRRVNLIKIFKALGVSELEFYSLAMDVIVKSIQTTDASTDDKRLKELYEEFDTLQTCIDENQERMSSGIDSIADTKARDAASILRSNIPDNDDLFSNPFPTKQYTLFAHEIVLIKAYLKLNQNGKREAIKRIQELAMIDKYLEEGLKDGIL